MDMEEHIEMLAREVETLRTRIQIVTQFFERARQSETFTKHELNAVSDILKRDQGMLQVKSAEYDKKHTLYTTTIASVQQILQTRQDIIDTTLCASDIDVSDLLQVFVSRQAQLSNELRRSHDAFSLSMWMHSYYRHQ